MTSFTDRCRVAVEDQGLPFVERLLPIAIDVGDFVKMTGEYVKARDYVKARGSDVATVEIPEQLRTDDFRFILIPKGKKGGGNEPDWQRTRNYAWNDPRLTAHLQNGGNYGVFPAAGSGIAILDSDDYAGCINAGLIADLDFRTFTVETGGSIVEKRKYHYFFRVNPPFEGKHPLYTDDGEHIGELYCQHPVAAKGYVVGANSVHPSGERYRVACDLPILEIDRDTYGARLSKLASSQKRALEPDTGKTAATSAPRSTGEGNTLSEKLGLTVTAFLMPLNARLRNGEWEGGHPVHPSATGTNLTCSDEAWYCRRHGTGGGPLEALAVAAGIIDCADAGPGCLKDRAVWRKVMDELRERGYDVGTPPERENPAWVVEDGDLDEAKVLTDQCKTFNMTDSGNADRFVTRNHRMIRYCHPNRSWLLWDGRRWMEDRLNLILLIARRTARKIYDEAGAENIDERRKNLAQWARSSEGESRLRAMINVATPDPDIAVHPDELDAASHLLNLQNGTMDLRSLEFHEGHRREDMLTKIAGVEYDPEAECPLWEAHMDLVFGGDEELIRSTQELLGYALLPGNPLQIFPIWWGDGANGKSVTLSVIREIFGEYATAASAELFMVQKQDGGPRPDLLALRGSRLVTAVESEQGHRLNESLIKQMTGGDPITARGLYKEMETFTPTHLAILATNPKPIIRGVEYAIWRRVLMWPFAVTIPPERRIVDYENVLLEEGPGILNWMIEGLRRYYANGCRISIPRMVTAATDEYKSDMDILAPFFLEECVLASDQKVDRGVLYDRYVVWCQDLGDDVMSKRKFAEALKERGIKDGGKSGNRRYWKGLRIKTQSEIRAEEEAGSFQANVG